MYCFKYLLLGWKFNAVFYKIANSSFGVYVLLLKMYLMMSFNLFKPITEVALKIV